MTHQPEKEPSDGPEFTWFTGSRRVRIAKSAGVVGLCVLLGGAYTYVNAQGPPTIHSKVVSPDNAPVHAKDLDGTDITLDPGTSIDVHCFGPNGYRFSINAGFWSIDPTAEGIPRANIQPLEDPFHADQAPGGPQDRLVPLGDC